MKNIALAAFLLAALTPPAFARPAQGPAISVPLASQATVEQPIGGSLVLRVRGDATGFEVEITSTKPVRDCYANLVHSAPHGPDASDVMPWHVTQHRFPDTRLIPVCGHSLAAEVSLVSPQISVDGERFTSGTLVVRIKPSKRGPRAGAQHLRRIG